MGEELENTELQQEWREWARLSAVSDNVQNYVRWLETELSMTRRCLLEVQEELTRQKGETPWSEPQK